MLDVSGVRVLARAGLLRPARPDQLLGMGLALARWGVSPAAGYAVGAVRHPGRTALVDDDGALGFRELERRTDTLACTLLERGLRPGDAVGLLARNGRGLVEGAVALSKVGADVLYLNTGTAPGPLAQVLERGRAVALVHDAELPGPSGLLSITTAQLAAVAASRPWSVPPRPGRVSRQVILTSGTTGAPRGAARSGGTTKDAVAALTMLPLRARETTVIAAPVFHAWGLGHLSMAMALGSTVVLSQHFDAEQVLASVQRHRASALVVVPVMLDQLVRAQAAGRYDTSSLRLIASSGSALPGDLATRALEAFGPVLHSLYGSTEVAYVAVATPADLARDPHTAGRAPDGVRLRLVDERGRPVRAGATGRIFAGSGLSFSGYTDGTDLDREDGLVATGDVGVLDHDGRLTVLGRDDDMAVVGGENVHPGQVEDVLLTDPSVADVAVVGVPDPAYGTRLVAHLVPTGTTIDERALAELVRSRLARYAVPREFRLHERLPRTTTGKVLREELRA